jgi:hypothetical protein
MTAIEHKPRDRVANFGEYEELDLFGIPTGRVAIVEADEKLPDAAIGYTWLFVWILVLNPPRDRPIA